MKRVPQRYKQITTDIQGRWNRRRISRITFVQFQDYPTRRCIFHFHEWFGLNSASGKLGEEVPCPNLNLQPTSPDLWQSNQFICTDQNICKTYEHMYRIHQHVLIHCQKSWLSLSTPLIRQQEAKETKERVLRYQLRTSMTKRKWQICARSKHVPVHNLNPA